MKILSVKINNILSIENAAIEFDDTGLMLVQGWNHDVGRANGAGKTAIFNAITFALFDKLPRKITATEILRRGSKTGYVEVRVERDGSEFTVKRSRPKGVAFFRDGISQVITQEEWEHKIGLNYNQFIISMYCAQGTSSRFLSLNDSDKKQFILQLLNLEEFLACKIIADTKVKGFESELELLKSRDNAHLAKIDAYSESLIDEDICKQQIDIINKSIVELTSDLRKINYTTRSDISKFTVLEDNIYSKKTEFAKTKMKREMLHDQYKKVQFKVRPFSMESNCKTCGAILNHSAAEIIHNNATGEARIEIENLKLQIDECDSILSKEQSINELAAKVAAKKRDESKEYEAASSKVADINSKLMFKQREAKELTLKLQNNSELQSKIKVLVADREEMLNKKAVILSNIDLYRTISSVYSPTGAQAYILDSVIDSFNEQVVFYINILWNNLTYSIQSYKENIKGDITAKFSEQLIMDSKPVSIGSLSGGEFRALSLCVDFALISVMERQFGISMSPIVLDEPYEGLDTIGREVIIDLLGTIAQTRQVIVIDHVSELKSMFSKILTVEKMNGISTVKLET